MNIKISDFSRSSLLILFMIWQIVFLSSADSASMQGLSQDADSRSNSTLASSSNTTLVAGSTGSPLPGSSPVLVFQLPNFGAVSNPFSSASLRVLVASKTSTPPNVDLYGLGRRASATVLATDYYGQTTTVDPSDATLLQNDFLTSSSANGPIYTNSSGTSLRNYLNTQYANGAGAGQYVFIRLSPDSAPSVAASFSITSANASANAPRIIYNNPSGNVRPFIWVRDSEKANILAKIAGNPWATSVYNGIVARVANDFASHQANRNTFLRQLPVINWTDATPRLKTIPAYSESTVRFILEQMLNDAQDCAVLFYLTGNEAYARCAADILHNTITTLVPVAASTSTGNGGWIFQTDLLKEARVNAVQLPIIYDLLHPWILTNQVYDVKKATNVNFNFTNAQTVFRKYYQLTRDHGQRDSNWSALMATAMLNNLLALDNTTERNTAIEVYLTTGTSRQASLEYDYRHYQSEGNIWPESLQYAGAVGSIRSTHLVQLDRFNPSLNLLDKYPNFPKSLPRISELRYPNGQQVSFGDGHRDSSGQPYFQYEVVYQHAVAIGDTKLATLLGSLINGGQAAGEYNRATLHEYDRLSMLNDPVQLLWQAAVIPEPSVFPELPRTDTLPYAGIALQRNESPTKDPNFGLMCFVGGAAHIHSHASGMSMEIYGAGHVMGAKSGRTSYGDEDHEKYYRLFAANNTVIVNGGSRGEGGWQDLSINTVQTVSMEPKVDVAPVSENYSFTCSSFADDRGALAEGTQQRTMAIVRTSPNSGYYVDFFRTRSTVTNRTATTLNGNVTNQYHDYIYRNFGDTAVELLADGSPLTTVSQPNRFANDIGDTYDQPGWRYFTNTRVSSPTNQAFRAKFSATVAGTPRYMNVHMPAVANREYAKVDSPAIVDAPSPYSSRVAPTLVIRQIGEAWEKAFATVYEPQLGNGTDTIRNVTTLTRGNVVCGVKVESTTGSRSQVQYVFSNPNPTETYTDSAFGITFKGRFGIISSNGDDSITLYLGDGSSIAYRGNSLATVSGTNSQAQARFSSGVTPVVTSNTAVIATPAPPPVGSMWIPTAAGSYSWNTATNWNPATIPNSMGYVARINSNITGNQTVNIDIPVTLGELALGDSSGNQTTTLQRGTNGSITFDQFDNATSFITRTAGGTGNVSIASNTNIILNDNLTVRTSGTSSGSLLTISGIISGIGKNLTKDSANFTLALAGQNTYSGSTKIVAGILSLENPLALQHSVLDSDLSLVGSATDGLRITVPTLTIGGLSGEKNFASLFTTTNNGRSALSDLTLNLATNQIHNYAGDISDGSAAMNLTKIGAGTQILTGNHSYTGSTTIAANGGELQIANGGSLGAGNYNAPISLGTNAMLHYSSSTTQNFSGAISGSGQLQKSNSDSTLTLSAANPSFTGTIIHNEGTLNLANSNAISAATSLTLSGTSILRTTIQNVICNAPVTIIDTPTIQAPDFGSGSTTSSVSLNSPLSGTGSIIFGATSTVANNSQQTILLNAASTYTGNTRLHPTGSNANLSVRIGINNALPITTVLSIDGSAGGGSGRSNTFDVNGFSQTVAGLSSVATSLRSQRVINSSTTPATFTINAAKDASFAGGINGSNLNLIKTGPARQTLSGSHTMTGTTTIADGILQGVTGGSLTNSPITVTSTTAALGVAITDNTKTWTCASVTTAAAGFLEFHFGNNLPSAVAPMTITGTATFSAAPHVRVIIDQALTTGTYPLMAWASTTGTLPTSLVILNSSGTNGLPDGSSASLTVSGNVLNLLITTLPFAVKANNANNLNLTTSWVNGTRPNATTTAVWNNTVTTANTTVLGANATWAGITINNPTGNVTINSGNTLTLGANATDINMDSATVGLTLNCAIALADAQVWRVAPSRTLTIGGVISGAYPITKEGAGTALLTAANTFTGNITLPANSGSFEIGGTSSLSAGIFSNSIEIGSNSTFRYNSSNALNISGELRGSGTLRKENSSLLTLSGANTTFSGLLSIHQGRVDLAHANALGEATAIEITGAAAVSSQLNEFTSYVPIVLSNDLTFSFGLNANARGTMRYSGLISGTGNVTFSTLNNSNNNLQTILLGEQNTYDGTTTITTANSGVTLTVRALQADTLPTTTILTLHGGNGAGSGRTVSFDLNGFDQTIAGLTNTTGLTLRNQRIFNTASQAATLTINNSTNFTYSGSISGNDLGINKTGSGTQTLAAANTHSGFTSVTEGILELTHSLAVQNSAIETTESIVGDATNGFKTTATVLTLGGLIGEKNLATIFTTTSGGYSNLTQLTLNPAAEVTCDYSGIITNGAAGMSVIKSGLGTQIFRNAHSYTGTTSILAGTLSLAKTNALPATPLTLGDATLAVGGFSQQLGTLDLTGDATLDLSQDATLQFADSSTINWTDFPTSPTATTLVIKGKWISGQSIRFGTNASGLSATQLASISAEGYGTFSLNSNGYLVATPLASYANWSAIHANNQLANLDADADGVPNGVEYVLGGSHVTHDRHLLPTLSKIGDNYLYRFIRNRSSIDPATTLFIETSPDLQSWPNSYFIPLTQEAAEPNISILSDEPQQGQDTISFTLPASEPTSFLRLKVVIP